MKLLTGESIKKLLKTETIEGVIYSFEEVGSTNEVAFELARNGASEGTIVITDSQTKGKGRLSRKWISPPGMNLYISAVFRPPLVSKDAPFLTLVASIAVAEAVKNRGADAIIKWPNDVLVNGKKVAGVLTQMQHKGDRVDFVIVGVGININMTREMLEQEMGEVAQIATSLREVLGHEVDRVSFSADLINELDMWYTKFLKDGKPSIIKEWTERWGAINRRVQVKYNGKQVEGIAIGIDGNGYLLVKKDDGTTERIIAGDILLV
ncbi:MAG TPA: biotin--[acetyl-CoA-carboxylase] ligase [Thermodesulfobacteriota bacterium]|nr:biotin--[acetyl-CoA-carboxylase] ligase [Thermodesulfobacteriota bacterium]